MENNIIDKVMGDITKINIYDIDSFKITYINIDKITYKNNKDGVEFDEFRKMMAEEYLRNVYHVKKELSLMEMIREKETDNASDSSSDITEELNNVPNERVIEILDDNDNDTIIGGIRIDPNDNNVD